MTNNPLNIGLDLATVREKIPSFTSEKLCEMIVCVRYLGLNSEITVACMEELATRRSNGDVFDFESYVATSQQDLPALDFTNPDFRTLLAQIAKNK